MYFTAVLRTGSTFLVAAWSFLPAASSVLLRQNHIRRVLRHAVEIARVVVTGNPAHIQQLDENNNLVQGDPHPQRLHERSHQH